MKIYSLLPLLFALLLLPEVLPAQEVKMSSSQRIRDKAYYPKVLGKFMDHYFVVRTSRQRRKTVVLEKYDKNLRLVASKSYRLKGKHNLEKIFMVQDKIVLFYSEKNNREYNVKLKAHIYNKSLTPDKQGVEVSVMPNMDMRGANFYIYRSKTRSELIISHFDSGADKDDAFVFKVVDKNLKARYKNTHQLETKGYPEIRELIYYQNAVFALYREDVSSKKKNPVYFYSLLKINTKSSSQQIYSLFYEDTKVIQGKITLDAVNEQFLFAGFYTSKETSLLEGTAFLSTSIHQDTFFYDYLPFSGAQIEQLMGRNFKGRGIKNFLNQELIATSDGGVMLFNEFYNVEEEVFSTMTSFGMPQSYVRRYYHYNDLFILSIDSDANEDWYDIVRKDQTTINDNGYYSSFVPMVQKESIALFYNSFSRRNPSLLKYELTSHGGGEKQVLRELNNLDGKVIPQESLQVSDHEIVFPGYERNNRNFVLVKITFEKSYPEMVEE